jgi:hypothetical protein
MHTLSGLAPPSPGHVLSDMNLAEWIDASAESPKQMVEKLPRGWPRNQPSRENTPNEPNSQALTKGNNQTN